MQLDELVVKALGSYKPNTLRSYRDCFEAGVLALARLIESQNGGKPMLAEADQAEPLALLQQELNRLHEANLESPAADGKYWYYEIARIFNAMQLIKKLQQRANGA